MTRAIAQSVIAVMLGFAVITLILRGVLYLKLGYRRWGIMYFGISLIAGFLQCSPSTSHWER